MRDAPRERFRADDVPAAQRVSHPTDAAHNSASRASRLFPTPAAPQTTIPDRSWSDIAASMIRNSSVRPVNGHMKRTQMVYERKRPRHRANGVTPE